jgi:DNA-directed RNA polymerase subunit L
MSASILHTTEEVAVTVKGEDYTYEGVLVGIIIKRNGKIRYVIEDESGRLFIQNAKQIGVNEGWMPM